MDDSLKNIFSELATGLNKGLAVFSPSQDGENFIFEEFNSIAEEMENISRSEVIGKPITEVFPGVKEFGLFDILKSVYKTSKPQIHKTSFYADQRIIGWRENHVQKLPSGHIITMYSNRDEEIETDLKLKRWANIFEHAQWGIVVGNNVMEDMNSNFAKMHGYTKEELIDLPPYSVFAPESRDDLKIQIERAHKKGHHQFESIHIRKDGSRFPVLLDITTVKNHNDEIAYRIVNVQDITEQKNAQRSLKESEKLYRSLFDGNADGIFIINEKGQFTDCNDSFCKMMGYSKPEALLLSQGDLCPGQPDCRYKNISRPEKPASSREVIDCSYQRKDGTHFPVKLTIHQFPEEKKARYWTVVRDMTLIRKAQQKQEAESKHLQSILQSLPIPVAIYQQDYSFSFLNNKFKEVMGYDINDIPTLRHWERAAFPDPKDQEAATQKWEKFVNESRKQSAPYNSQIFKMQCKDKTVRSFEISMRFHNDIRIVCFNEITVLLKTQEDLEDSRERFKLFMDHFPGAAFIKDHKEEYYFVNKWYSSKFDISLDKMPSTQISSYWDNKDQIFRSQDELVRKTNSPQDFKDEFQGENGTEYYLTRKFPIQIGDQPTMIGGISIDITDQHLMEKEKDEMHEQVIHSAKLASIGELAASIGHEIRNPLTIIQGYTDQMKNTISKDTIDRDRLNRAIEKQLTAVKRITTIVDGLKNFARSDADIIEFFDAHDAINETLDLVSFIYGKEGITIEKDLNCPTPIISGNFGKFQQVLMNLFTNAKDAMMDQEEKIITIKTQNDLNLCKIFISDNGTGIPKDVQDKIFDPFFTTKSFGEGTGLGLGISKSIINGISGEITFNSIPEHGTEFIITLPLQ